MLFDDEVVRVEPMPGRDDEVMLSLPFTYFDDVAGEAEVGIDRSVVPALIAALSAVSEPSPLRVRSSAVRLTHEAIRTRLGALLPVCGAGLHNPVQAANGSPVTCPFCTEQPVRSAPLQGSGYTTAQLLGGTED